MIRGKESEPGPVQMHFAQVKGGIVIDVIEMHKRKHAGVGSPALQMRYDVGAL